MKTLIEKKIIWGGFVYLFLITILITLFLVISVERFRKINIRFIEQEEYIASLEQKLANKEQQNYLERIKEIEKRIDKVAEEQQHIKDKFNKNVEVIKTRDSLYREKFSEHDKYIHEIAKILLKK